MEGLMFSAAFFALFWQGPPQFLKASIGSFRRAVFRRLSPGIVERLEDLKSSVTQYWYDQTPHGVIRRSGAGAKRKSRQMA
jgi:hypothetical protein